MKYDKILVIDVESTCWEEFDKSSINEIIEIGITPISTKTGDLLDSIGIIVKPQYSKVSQFCTKLTTLTQETVDKGISFRESCSVLRNLYDSKNYVCASYGNYDKNQFLRQCERENVEYPFSDNHINVKSLFALKYSLKKEIGMGKAIERMNIPLIGTHHRGIDDSRNIATILSKILF